MKPGRTKRADSPYRVEARWLASQLRAARLAQGLSQERLAQQAHVSLSTLRKIESGQVIEPGFFTVTALLRALHLSLGELERRRSAT